MNAAYLRKHSAGLGADLIRWQGHVLSDEDLKEIKECCDPKELAAAILEGGPPFNEEEVKILAEAVGNMDEDTDFERDGDVWRDDVLDRYAEHLYNYEYTYKPEAKKIDPGIDPKEKHIGVMAQDLEKVNRATIEEVRSVTPGKEEKDPVKTVDVSRVALMNAGAIASLKRQLNDLKEKVEAISE